MKVVRSQAGLRSIVARYRRRGESIGFVPTMGDLHQGHLSLLRRARRENDRLIVSIFVNPAQFGPNEDFKTYPRPFRRDRDRARREKTDVLFIPSVRTMYPRGFQTEVEVTRLGRPLCGRHRPGHFRGVATVVAKLFMLAQPDRAYFGLKDYQQAMLVRQLARDLALPVTPVFCPLVRDRDGLALSSRNRYLGPAERARAIFLSKALRSGAALIRSGRRNPGAIRKHMRNIVRKGSGDIHYVDIVDPKTLERVNRIQGRVLLAVAARIGRTRLIDNMPVRA